MEALWVLDGYNVIRRDPRLREVEATQGTEVARTLLLSQVRHFRAQQRRGVSVVIVYDGGFDGPVPRSKGVRVAFPPPGRSADDTVLAEAKRAEGRQEVTVVTSDLHDIASRLRGLSARHMTVEEFADRLWPDAGGDDVAASADKPEQVSKGDVDFWMREFGDDQGSGTNHEGE